MSKHPLQSFFEQHPDLTAKQVAEATGLGPDAVRYAAGILGHTLPSAQRKVYLPSQAEIEVASAEIRSQWSDSEKLFRQTGFLKSEQAELRRWNVPEVTVPIDRDRHLAE